MNSMRILGSMALLLVSASAMAITSTDVPEPATFGLIGLGLAAIAAIRRKR
jgi:PEP-CTERM motif-containing protein